MLKFAMLASAMMVAAPAIAQTAPQGGMAPQTSPAMPGATVNNGADTGTVQTDPQAAPAQAAPATADATTTAAQPSQVAQVVDQEFATYDKDGNGTLSKAEFAAWMTKLKSSTPDAKPLPAAKQTAWNNAAFKQADADKSASVDKTELTSFLNGASNAG